eukprot:gene7822-40528_t
MATPALSLPGVQWARVKGVTRPEGERPGTCGERRVADDGAAYTRQQFKRHYGGLREWRTA